MSTNIWYAAYIGIWTTIVTVSTVFAWPESSEIGTAIIAGLAISALAWIPCGMAGYWLTVLFDRLTGLAISVPGTPLTFRHVQNQMIGGPVLLLTGIIINPLHWLLMRNCMAAKIEVSEHEAPGVVIAGKRSCSHDGWHRLKYVPGTKTYRDARARRKHARWVPLSEVQELSLVEGQPDMFDTFASSLPNNDVN